MGTQTVFQLSVFSFFFKLWHGSELGFPTAAMFDQLGRFFCLDFCFFGGEVAASSLHVSAQGFPANCELVNVTHYSCGFYCQD